MCSVDNVTHRLVSDPEIAAFEEQSKCSVYLIANKTLARDTKDSFAAAVSPLLNAIVACAMHTKRS
jgi:hypothetical protein